MIEEAKLFYSDGHFSSELGNSLILAISNVLKLPIIVFTTISNFQLLPIFPRDPINYEEMLPVAFNDFGPGHYDAVDSACERIPKENIDQDQLIIDKEVHVSSLENEEVSVKCHCGRGARKDDSAYLTCLKYWCLCFKQNLPCNMNCQCKNCNNPKGSTRKRVAEVIPRAFNQRKRRAHTTKTIRDNAFYSPRLTVKYPWQNVEIYLLLQLIESLGLDMNCLQSEMLHEEH